MESEAKRPVGRPNGFNERLSRKIADLVSRGKTIDQIAEIISVHPSTIYNWGYANPEFLEHIKEARQAANELVEAALFRRAVGYSHPETKFFAHEGRVVDERETIKHYPPDPTSCIFWLKCRKPEEWSEPKDPEDKPSAERGEDFGDFDLRSPNK